MTNNKTDKLPDYELTPNQVFCCCSCYTANLRYWTQDVRPATIWTFMQSFSLYVMFFLRTVLLNVCFVVFVLF